MFGFAKPQPLLQDEQTQWMFDVFSWCLQNFNADFFHQHSVLVLPSNRFFPGRADSAQDMAQLIFNNVKRYAGIVHWPTQVVDHNTCSITTNPQITINGPLRISASDSDQYSITTEHPLTIPYNPQQISNPEGLIASFAHITAHHMGQMAQQPPPGGAELWPHTTEMLAIFLGFGLMFANSAYTFRGGCGSCYNASANRDAFLTEQQSVYGLALFAVLKGLPNSEVVPNMKKHLRSFYKKAVKDIQHHSRELDQLSATA